METEIENHPAVQKWLRLKRSPTTRYNYALRLKYFLEHFKMNVDELLEMSAKEVRELCLIYQNEAKTKKGKPLSSNAILARQTAVASFLDYCDKPIEWKRNTKVKPRADVTSHVFSNGDLSRMFEVGDVRDKAMLALATSLGWEISAFVDLKRESLRQILERQEETGEEFVYFRQIREKTGEPRLAILNPLAIKWTRKWFKDSEKSSKKERVGKPRSHDSKLRISDIFDLTGRGILSRIKVLGRRAGLKTTGNLRFHNIRKWVMSGLSRSGMNEWQVKYVLGKSILMSDATYLQTLEQEVRERYPSAYENYLNLETSVPRKTVEAVSKDLATKTSEIEELKKQMAQQAELFEKMQTQIDYLRRIEEDKRICDETKKLTKKRVSKYGLSRTDIKRPRASSSEVKK